MKILDEASLSNRAKVELWHAGKRKENIKACGEEKLADFYRIAKSMGYSEILDAIDSECDRRGISHFGASSASTSKAVKVEPSVRDINKTEEITDKIFNVLIRSMDYAVCNKIKYRVIDKGDRSMTTATWPNPSYKNLKEVFWEVDWYRYRDYVCKGDTDKVGEFMDQCVNEIKPVIDMAKEQIIEKYKSKDPSVIPLVEKILAAAKVYTSIRTLDKLSITLCLWTPLPD